MLVKHDQRLNCYKAHVCIKFDWSNLGCCHRIGLIYIYIHQICSKTVISKLIVGLKTHYVLSSKKDVTLPGPVCWMSLLSSYLSFTSFWKLLTACICT